MTMSTRSPALPPQAERRVVPAVELRVAEPTGANEEPILEGYAAVFNALSEELWGFREMIAPGAFADAIASSDIRSLFNHNPDLILGRVSAKTLEVREDDQGLWQRTLLPATSYGRDLAVSVRRGDVTQMSFAFIVAEEQWAATADGVVVRTILRVQELFDVSPVTYPAYPDTTVALRSLDAARADGRLPAVPRRSGQTLREFRHRHLAGRQ